MKKETIVLIAIASIVLNVVLSVSVYHYKSKDIDNSNKIKSLLESELYSNIERNKHKVRAARLATEITGLKGDISRAESGISKITDKYTPIDEEINITPDSTQYLITKRLLSEYRIQRNK